MALRYQYSWSVLSEQLLVSSYTTLHCSQTNCRYDAFATARSRPLSVDGGSIYNSLHEPVPSTSTKSYSSGSISQYACATSRTAARGVPLVQCLLPLLTAM